MSLGDSGGACGRKEGRKEIILFSTKLKVGELKMITYSEINYVRNYYYYYLVLKLFFKG